LTILAPPKQTLPLFQPGIQSGYFIKTKNIPPEMSIEESLGAIAITLLLIPFVFITSFQIVRNSARSLGLV